MLSDFSGQTVLCCVGCILMGCVSNNDQPSLRIEASTHGNSLPVVVASHNGKWPKSHPNDILTFRLPDGNHLLGQHQFKGNSLTFKPRFPLVAGIRYKATLSIPGTKTQIAFYTLPNLQKSAPNILKIFPSTSTLPANHLKFYLCFSMPMEQGNIFRHLQLLDAKGKPVSEPFRETELWAKDGKRLTLWFHPGRQKTGVNLNVDLGPVLMKGNPYTLVISGKWKSLAGIPLGKDFKKTFDTIASDRNRLVIANWQISASSEKVALEFNEPMDWALLHSQITVLRANGEAVLGKVITTQSEQRWQFFPDKPLKRGKYKILVGWELEDLAGNNLHRAFEVDLEKSTESGNPKPLLFPFIIH